MKVTLDPYTHTTINSNDIVYAVDILELRSNIQKLMTAYSSHIGTRNANDGGTTESDPEVRQHGVVSTTSPGFAPRNIDYKLEEGRSKLAEFKRNIMYDCYPDYSIAIWYGKKTDILPMNWLFCDGEEILYTYIDPETELEIPVYTPDLRYTEVVSVSSDRDFLKSMNGQMRESVSSASTSNPGEAVSKWYIIKKPHTTETVTYTSLTVKQPKEVRIDTNYTTKGDLAKLKALSPNSEVTVQVPVESKVTFDVLEGTNYELSKLYVTHSLTGETSRIGYPGSLTATVGDNLTLYAEESVKA